jgi:hypothetical protein
MTQAETSMANAEVRPFPTINVPEEELVDLRRRIAATRWPERETVTHTARFWWCVKKQPKRDSVKRELGKELT